MSAEDFTVGFALPEELAALKYMWRVSFDESESGADFVFSRLQKPQNMLVLRVGSTPAAMLSIAQAGFGPGGTAKVAYLYGVATLPEFRGRGCATFLLRHADSVLKRAGFSAAALVPENQGLFEFYEKRGYETAFRQNRAEVTAAELKESLKTPLTLLDISSPERFKELRDRCAAENTLTVRWNEDYLEYILAESVFRGGGVFELNSAGASAAAVCHADGARLFVKELAFYGQNNAAKPVEEALLALLARFPAAEQYTLYLREDIYTPYTNKLLPFGMIKWYDDNIRKESARWSGPAYIAHVLD
jgi:ribosomal protein S18 acetylase RimI-like enzyme